MCEYDIDIYTQKWARAYRDCVYHAAVNTNNGAETLNKLLKYSFLPRKKSLTLSTTVSLLIEEFLPVSYEKYLFQITNSQASTDHTKALSQIICVDDLAIQSYIAWNEKQKH